MWFARPALVRTTALLLPSPLIAGRASDNVAQLKREAMSFMTAYMQAQKMDTEEGAPLLPRDRPTA